MSPFPRVLLATCSFPKLRHSDISPHAGTLYGAALLMHGVKVTQIIYVYVYMYIIVTRCTTEVYGPPPNAASPSHLDLY